MAGMKDEPSDPVRCPLILPSRISSAMITEKLQSSRQGLGRNFFRGRPISIEPVLTTKYGRNLKFGRLKKRCVKIKGHAPPADAMFARYKLRHFPIQNVAGLQQLFFTGLCRYKPFCTFIFLCLNLVCFIS